MLEVEGICFSSPEPKARLSVGRLSTFDSRLMAETYIVWLYIVWLK